VLNEYRSIIIEMNKFYGKLMANTTDAYFGQLLQLTFSRADFLFKTKPIAIARMAHVL